MYYYQILPNIRAIEASLGEPSMRGGERDRWLGEVAAGLLGRPR